MNVHLESHRSQTFLKQWKNKARSSQAINAPINEITDAMTHFLAKDCVPFNAVERPGFKNLLRVLEPCYEVPAKSTFSRQRVVKLYDVMTTNVLDELKNSVDFYAATTDTWSSYGMTPYIGFTLHWIDDQWNL